MGLLDAQLTGPSDNLFVGRLSRNVLEESRVGLIVTNGDPLSRDSSSLVGTDFQFEDGNWRGTGRTLRSNLWFQNSFTEGESGLEGAWGAELRYDDGNNLVRYTGGAKGIIHASQISNGDENALNIRAYGTKASIEWHQEDPNELIVKYANAPRKTYRRGNDYVGAEAQKYSRTPFAHPEGFIEAFANIYLAVAEAITDRIDGNEPPEGGYDFPGVNDGIAGMAFIQCAVESSNSEQKWVKFPDL